MNHKKVFLSFLIGLLAGAALYKCAAYYCKFHQHGSWGWGMHREFKTDRILKKYTKELDLTNDQKQIIEKILSLNLQKFKELKSQVRPQFEEIKSQTQSEIKKVLTLEQTIKFEKMIEEREKKRKRGLKTH